MLFLVVLDGRLLLRWIVLRPRETSLRAVVWETTLRHERCRHEHRYNWEITTFSSSENNDRTCEKTIQIVIP